MSQGRKVRAQLDRVQEQSAVGRHTHTAAPADVNPPANQGRMPVADLPRKYQLKDKGWANRNEIKQQLMAAGDPDTGMTPFGQVQLTDRDIAALQERQRVEAAAAFDGWFGQNFNRSDLPTRLLGEELNPEYYKEREEAMVERAQMALRLELMKLYGPRSEEDLILIYGLQNGLIRLDVDSMNIDTTGKRGSAADIYRTLRSHNAVSRFLLSDAENQVQREDKTNQNPFTPAAGFTGSGRQFGSFRDLLNIF